MAVQPRSRDPLQKATGSLWEGTGHSFTVTEGLRLMEEEEEDFKAR